MAVITRSTGTNTGYLGIRAGAGYEGATADLDATIKAAADTLAKRFGRDVQIRFNSDRLSGGAFIEGGNVGITAKLWNVAPQGSLRAYFDKYPDDEAPDWRTFCQVRGLDPDGPAEQITLAVMIGAEGLADIKWANAMVDDPARAYAYSPAETIPHALALLVERSTLTA